MADTTPRHPPLVLHSSLVRLALTSLTPALLLGIGIVGLLQRVWALTILLTVLGLAMAAVVLFDVPLRTEFDRDGFTRICLVRRERVPWSAVVALERVRRRPPRRGGSLFGVGGDDDETTERASPVRAPATPPDAPPRRPPRAGQGLVARLGPRRLSLLVDRRESLQEYDVLRTLLRDEATLLRAAPPPLESAPAGRGPTALHRRLG